MNGNNEHEVASAILSIAEAIAAQDTNRPRELGYTEATAAHNGITTITDLNSMTVTVDVPSGAIILITGYIPQITSSVTTDRADLSIREGSTTISTKYIGAHTQGGAGHVMARIAPSAGTHTYKLSVARGVGTGTISNFADATSKMFIKVDEVKIS